MRIIYIYIRWLQVFKWLLKGVSRGQVSVAVAGSCLGGCVHFGSITRVVRQEVLQLCCRAALLKLEEEYIERQCQEIIKHKPDLVVTEKGLSDLAMHFLTKAGISAIRRLRKTDNNRIARATGATIVHRRVHGIHTSTVESPPMLSRHLCM